MPETAGEAHVSINRDDSRVAACNAAAAALLGTSEEELIGSHWRRVLAADEISKSMLGHILASERQVLLPSFLTPGASGEELIVAGVALPAGSQTRLVLWPVMDAAMPGFPEAPESGDTLAVLGVDNLRYSEDTAPAELSAMMAGVRSSLADIVRSGDVVSSPLGNAVVINLRSVSIQRARDICRALLSHLHRLLKQGQGLGSTAQLSIGLAHYSPERSALSTLLAANSALSLARAGGSGDQVRVEQEGDHQLLVASAINRGGALGARMQQVATSSEQARTASVQAPRQAPVVPAVQPIERDIDGYVVDNMEGAVDQALFLARLDVPVAIIGPAGTGKMYVARVMHEATGGADDLFVQIDCREFRGRKSADARLARELSRGEGRTLVLKSPHLMHVEVQQKLARQISTRVYSDAESPRALTGMKFIALFPQELDLLLRKGELSQALASAFAGYPIHVPPIRDRKQAVLRWAHKILVQEATQRDREIRGYTPDAEQAMLLYDWPGNISEMRQCISDALDKTDKSWLTPVDLGLFEGIDPEGTHFVPESRPYLATAAEADEREDEGYEPSTLESLDVALGQSVRAVLELEVIRPLGTWLEDDLVLAALERYRDAAPRTAEFLHTRSRNIGRWLPKIAAREEERTGSALWQTPRRLLREWVRESSQMDDSPMLMLQNKLLAHIEEQAASLSTAKRAQLMGVSTPTYLKRVKERV